MSDQHSGVYFIRRSGDGAIKIGYSRDVARRIGALQTGCPDNLTLAGLMTGGTKADEWNLQQRFRALSIHGEWFKPGPELLEYVGQHPAPEYFNEDRLRAKIKRASRSFLTTGKMAEDRYSGPVPASFSMLRIPYRIPVRRGLKLTEWAAVKDLDAYERALTREYSASVDRAARAYPAKSQTEDPVLGRLVEFSAWARAVRPVLHAYPKWRAGDALRFLAQQEGGADV